MRNTGKPFGDLELEVKQLKEKVKTLQHQLSQKNITKIQGSSQDNTSLRQTEGMRNQNEETLNLFFKQSLSGFFIMLFDEPVEWNNSVDKKRTLDYIFDHQRIIKVNQAMLDQYRAQEADLLGKTPRQLFQHDLEHGKALWRELMNNGKLHITSDERRIDGTQMWVEGDYICMYDDLGRVIGHFGNQQDISGRIKEQEELQKSKSNLVEYFENDISADYVVSVEGEIFSCNKTFLDLFGFENKSESQFFDITHLYKNPLDRQQMIQFIKQNKKIENHEVAFVSKTRKHITALVNAIGIFDQPGKLTKIRGYIVDISDLKKAENDLRLFRTLIDESSDAVEVLDPETGRFLDVNERGLRDLGYSRDEFLTLSVFDIDPLVDASIYERTVKKLNTENHLIWEGVHMRKDGSRFQVEVNLRIVQIDKPYMIAVVRDITQRKIDQEALNNSEEKYRILFAQNPQPMWIYDLQSLAFLEVNQAAISHYGYSRKEFLSMSLKDIRPPGDIPDLLKDVSKTDQDFNKSGVWRHVKKNGEIIQVQITSHTVSINNRKARHVLVNDVTEKKETEAQLIKLSSAIEQSSASIFITGLDGGIEYVNPTTIKLTGYEKTELIGQNPRLFNSGEKSVTEYKKLWETILSGRTWFGEFHNRKKNGELYWESASISPIFNKKNEITNFVAVKENITERKRLENIKEMLVKIADAIISSENLEEFFNAIFTELTKLIVTKNFYIASYNANEQILSTHFIFDAVDDSILDFPAENTLSGYVIKTRKSLLVDEIGFRKLVDAGEIQLLGPPSQVWIGVPIFDRDTVTGVVVIQNYSGEKKLTEEDLKILEYIAPAIGLAIERKKSLEDLKQAKLKAEESDRLKSAFLANMSHEIRTPMNGILGFAELLKEPGLSGKEQREYLKIIEKSGARMLNIVNDIIDISKIESGQIKFHYSPTNVNMLMDDLFSFFKPEADSKEVSLTCQKGLSDHRTTIITDKDKLNAILINLLKNAVKYTNQGSIEFGYKVLREANSKIVQFQVKDTGIGISADEQETIFERFLQAGIPDTMARQGAGLGLSISKAFVTLLGGKIWVESEMDQGSIFYFTIPDKTGQMG